VPDTIASSRVETINDETYVGRLTDGQGLATCHPVDRFADFAPSRAHIGNRDQIPRNARVTFDYAWSQGRDNGFISLYLISDIPFTGNAQFGVIERLCLPEDEADALFVFLESCDIGTRKAPDIRHYARRHRDFDIHNAVVRRDNGVDTPLFVSSENTGGAFSLSSVSPGS
jgi:hypothetical protein